jgi:AcrR family transcriptional regulator
MEISKSIAPLPVGLRTAIPKKKTGNRERILLSSIDLFNQSGVVAVTTNHIAQHLGISPGNLYFHFRNKEEIIYELFEMMCNETYEVWKPAPVRASRSTLPSTPSELIERSYEVFWKYRFFHREMYHLRRKDPNLAKRWKAHISKTMRLLQAMYAQWVKEGVMRKINDPREMQMISDTVLITSSSFLQFFESPEKPATRRSLRTGLEHLLLFLMPFHTESFQSAIRDRMADFKPASLS